MSNYDNTYKQNPTGQAASYGQTGTGTDNFGTTNTYGQTNTGSAGTYGQTNTGTTGTYGQTTGTTGTYGQSTTEGTAGTGAYPEPAYTTPSSKEHYTSTNYNATAPEGAPRYNQGDLGEAGYGPYSEPNASPPPNYMAAKTQQVKTYYSPADSTLAWKRKFCTALCCCICLGLIIGIPAGFTAGHSNRGCQCWNNNDCYAYYGPGVYCYSNCLCYRG